VDVFEALADPTRREIVALLAAGELAAGDIARRFDMAVPSVSRHLKVLRECGLITYQPKAQSRIYQLNAAKLLPPQRWMKAQINLCRARFDRLSAHLNRMKEKEARNAKDKSR
jgi:DNA-binding transcriptional ArsR family regulator